MAKQQGRIEKYYPLKDSKKQHIQWKWILHAYEGKKWSLHIV